MKKKIDETRGPMDPEPSPEFLSQGKDVNQKI